MSQLNSVMPQWVNIHYTFTLYNTYGSPTVIRKGTLHYCSHFINYILAQKENASKNEHVHYQTYLMGGKVWTGFFGTF